MMRKVPHLRTRSNVERLRRDYRSRIHCRRLLRVEYAGGDQERLHHEECGWTLVQRVGGAREPMDPALAKKLANYRGKLSDGSPGGIMGECPRCTKRERDRQYPKDWSPWGPPRPPAPPAPEAPPCSQCGGTGRRSTARSANGRELERHERSGTPCDACGGRGR